MEIINTKDIICGLKTGTPDSFHKMYHEYCKILIQQSYSVLKNREQAEEVTHETFITAVKKINFLKYQNENSLKNWLIRICVNKSIDILRRTKNIGINEVVLNLETAEDIYITREKSFLMEREFQALPLLQRSAVSLRVLEDLSYMDISKVLGVSIDSVKQSIYKAKKTLKVNLQEKEWCNDRI